MKKFTFLAIIFSLLTNLSAIAGDAPTFIIEIKNNKFSPEVVKVPADKEFTLVVKNQDKTLEEFESVDLKIEKFVKGGKEIIIKVKPLKVGEYKFFGEFHPKTAQGKVVAE